MIEFTQISHRDRGYFLGGYAVTWGAALSAYLAIHKRA